MIQVRDTINAFTDTLPTALYKVNVYGFPIHIMQLLVVLYATEHTCSYRAKTQLVVSLSICRLALAHA
jgi:hypothetical protein